MTPAELKDWLEGRDPRVAITIAFRIAARFWPMARWSGRVVNPSAASARALLIAERVARAPDGSAIRGMDDNVLRGAAKAAMEMGGSDVDPLEPHALLLEGWSPALPGPGPDREARCVSTLASLTMAVAVSGARRSGSNAAPVMVAAMAQYSSDLFLHLEEGPVSAAKTPTIDAALRADRDCVANSGLEALWRRQLWPSGRNRLYKQWRSTWPAIRGSSDADFFRRWYQGILKGDPVNLEVLAEIASIPPADWDQGTARVAERIAEIELHHIRNSTPLAEIVQWIPEAERIRIAPVPMDDAPTWNMILNKLRDALHDIRPDGRLRNAHAALHDTLQMLERTLDRYCDSPQRMHDDIATALHEARRLLKAGEIPDDMNVQRFMRALDENALDIQGSMPGVLEAVSRRASLRYRRLPDDDRSTLAGATNAVVPLLEEERHREDMKESLVALDAQDPNSPENSASIYRWASRLSRIYQDPKVRGFFVQVGERITVGGAVELLRRVLGL
ncbi:MAG: hypothetical protein F4Y60_08705 [Boseongicola sp. SB0664_bin_43]|uniref:Uncharacterized protein n=1 Tax=Boseongicola sp. SB0664_bin_43 TaxID=2604844 RepID=A0A6B0XZX3_9RHOB|nr:hypothetical protein [Boseongicola sp. SB0664_bin_43]MYK32282.1 hypothetical protein [Boseongicola sp. SB0670_bin_30]